MNRQTDLYLTSPPEGVGPRSRTSRAGPAACWGLAVFSGQSVLPGVLCGACVWSAGTGLELALGFSSFRNHRCAPGLSGEAYHSGRAWGPCTPMVKCVWEAPGALIFSALRVCPLGRTAGHLVGTFDPQTPGRWGRGPALVLFSHRVTSGKSRSLSATSPHL